MYEAHWPGLLSPSWEHEQDLQHHRLYIHRYWSGTPSQHRLSNRIYRQVPIGAAYRELARTRGEMFPPSRVQPRPTHPLASTLRLHDPPCGEHLWYKAHRTSTDNSSANSYAVRFLDDPGPIKIDTTSRSAVHGSWYLQRHQVGGLVRGVLRNADVPRGALSIRP